MLPSIRDRRHMRGSSPTTAEHRLNIKHFLPMPSIASSPICTPTTVMNTGEVLATNESIRVLPIWMATPPTPPANATVRRSVTCVVRSSSPLSPSASFPDSAAALVPSSRRLRPRRPRALSDSSVRHTSFPERIRPTAPELAMSHPEDADESSFEKAKDDMRRYHALKELLATEVSYLGDLRALSTIYLHNLPTLCRTQSPFSLSPSRNSSVTHLPKTTVLSDQGLHPLTTIHSKPKQPGRQLFTSREMELLARNAQQVLLLHENFVQELRSTLLPIGFGMDVSANPGNEKLQMTNLDAAVAQVSAKFATEASRFDAYQVFCSGHSEALHLVHRAQHQFASEWETFEQHCACLISSMNGECTSPQSVRSRSESAERFCSSTAPRRRTRTTSLTSIERSVRKVGDRTNPQDSTRRRLTFLDYMIKPIQRICRYPLLLDQLRPSSKLHQLAHPSIHAHVNVVVDSATQAMRHVASAVDEARHRHDVRMQSSLIISRIALAPPSTATSHMASVTLNPHLVPASPPFQILTPSFLSSLGVCLLAGSLDVMHYHSSQPTTSGINVSAKYLGAFLYLGGYLMLVKVSKNKVYEPRHWFPLADFEVVEQEEEDTSLPCTFSLISDFHQFDLTAACEREKNVWLRSIHEARVHPPAWINEPTSSIQIHAKSDRGLDEPYELVSALPTIQSLPELAKDDVHDDLKESVLAAFREEVAKNVVMHAEMPSKAPELVTSRRSSSASVAAKLTANSEGDSIIIRRSSPTARSQVDQGLQDVVSEPILAARSGMRDELFQAPKIIRTSGSFSRSSSALSLTSLTKNRLSKHESMRVPRKRGMSDDTALAHKSTSLRGTHKGRPRRLSIVSASETDSIFHQLYDVSPSPFSQCSSMSSSQTSPTLESHQVRTHSHKSSVASNQSSIASGPTRPSSPAPSLEQAKTMTQGIIKRLTKGSRHRRTRSVPMDENVPTVSTVPPLANSMRRGISPTLPNLDFGPVISLASPTAATDPVHASPSPSPSRSRLLTPGAPVSFRNSFADAGNTDKPTPRSPMNKRASIFKLFRDLAA
ncbi:DH domain-containing protein [Mycena kentingensis (nom. inval.)]|nr:DH domain-containing protein [Mycena kentingensis (nom. inval.)]